MRVITGTAKGKRLFTPDGEAVRPTPEKVKEAVFSAVQFEIADCRFLDLFAGSGQMGVEALSRGAKSCCFCDVSAAAAKLVKRNVVSCGFGDRANIMRCDYVSCLENCGKFDMAFLDPPYSSGLLVPALLVTAGKIGESGIVICEHPAEDTLPENAGAFRRVSIKKYGKVCISMYRFAG